MAEERRTELLAKLRRLLVQARLRRPRAAPADERASKACDASERAPAATALEELALDNLFGRAQVDEDAEKVQQLGGPLLEVEAAAGD